MGVTRTTLRVSGSPVSPQNADAATVMSLLGFGQVCLMRRTIHRSKRLSGRDSNLEVSEWLSDRATNPADADQPRLNVDMGHLSPQYCFTVRLLCGDGVARRKNAPASPRSRRRRILHGPYFGAGVWLKSGSSATQVKFAAMLGLPLPLYLATLG